ncbi:EamA family transporter [Aliamphritea spongicola]|uniref:EamA family transporter n=1 Tax=Aliamphritea spongicola TaxID=707589 RepID=UPI00196B3878|nr:EamA family transporter [Aliamphritea spongicola]MBN3563312.1 EamA family transporter [Aliamphritea spongicola]
MNFRDTLLGLIIVVVWGFNFVVIAWGLEGMPPLLLGGLRFLLVAALGCWFVARPDVPLRWLLAYGLTLGFAQFALLFTAMHLGMPAGLASLVLQSQAFFTLILAAFWLKEDIRRYQLLAIMIAASGLVLIGWGDLWFMSAALQQNMTAIGFGLTIAAAVAWALGNIVNRQIHQHGFNRNKNGAISLVVWSAWIPPLPFFALSLYLEGPLIENALLNIGFSSVFALVYLALIATILGYSLWGYLLSSYPVSQVAPLTLGVPVVGLSCAAWLLDEQLSSIQWLGIFLVLAGLGVNMRGPQLLRWLRRSGKATAAEQ